MLTKTLFRRAQIAQTIPRMCMSAIPEKAELSNRSSCESPVLSSDLSASVRWAKEVVQPFQVYSLLNQDGTLRASEDFLPQLAPSEWKKLYSQMVRLSVMDEIFLQSQRQGRISFYMASTGEEAIHIGSASALESKDVIFAQYREQGVLLYRGATLQELADQCFSNAGDIGKGRQMPVHYGNRSLNFQTISSPLGTQIPQAAGAAYSLKLDGKGAIAVCYFGEGAASEGDFHAGMNFASTLEVPIVFFCRNNGYAISTPTRDQFRGDGIASRAVGYDMPAIRVDGNDLAAVYSATAEARRIAVEQQRPVFVEAMTYRVGHHSTSDDSTRYRSVDEIKEARKSDPIARVKSFWSSAVGGMQLSKRD